MQDSDKKQSGMWDFHKKERECRIGTRPLPFQALLVKVEYYHDYQMSRQPFFKKKCSIDRMLIKDKYITSHQLLLIKQDRVLVKYNICFIWNFIFFYFSKKMGRSGDEKRNILGQPKDSVAQGHSTIDRIAALNHKTIRSM